MPGLSHPVLAANLVQAQQQVGILISRLHHGSSPPPFDLMAVDRIAVSPPRRFHETGLSWYQRAWAGVKVDAPTVGGGWTLFGGFLRDTTGVDLHLTATGHLGRVPPFSSFTAGLESIIPLVWGGGAFSVRHKP